MTKDYGALALQLHRKYQGKLAISSKVMIRDREDLSVVYTPGVAQPCLEIAKDPATAYEYTCKGNLIAVVSDGTAVLGLGNIGGAASMPVMEGKCVLFKNFGGVDAIPICLQTQDPEEIITVVKNICPTFGGINLEDIKAPQCFYIEQRLKEETTIPIFHDDQHGTAVVALAGLYNALKIVGKKIDDLKIVLNGAGAAGTAISTLLLNSGVKNLIVCDRAGAIYQGMAKLNWAQEELAKITNPNKEKGLLQDVIKGADVFIGVSAPGVLLPEMVRSMAAKAIVFAQANPVPEIDPDEAKKAGALVVATGRSDYPNQINNVLAFPGIFRGALDVRATDINEQMKIAAANALANFITPEQLNENYIIPGPLDPMVGVKLAAAVAVAAVESGVAIFNTSYEEEIARAKKIILGSEEA
jgi:malate dehydrogenase (oxaloacetate-decarboxylating)